MTECERLKTCPFFNRQMWNRPSVAEWMKSEKGHGDKTLGAEGIGWPRPEWRGSSFFRMTPGESLRFWTAARDSPTSELVLASSDLFRVTPHSV
jgi:hypothetical protein